MNPLLENPSTENPSETESTTATLAGFIKTMCEGLITNLRSQNLILKAYNVNATYCMAADQLKLAYLKWILFYCWLNTLGLIWIALTVQFHPLSSHWPPENEVRQAAPPAVERPDSIHRELKARNVA